MILLFECISQINNLLLKEIEEHRIDDFRIILRVNNNINVVVLISNEVVKDSIFSRINNFNEGQIEIEFASFSEKEIDPYLNDLFKSTQKVLLNSRKNLSNLLNQEILDNKRTKSKVVTFYSYKGGVGRSTTLASCAAYLANHFRKKVVIIDCDFEAPGFTNYFLEEPSQSNHHQGVVEYFMDREFLKRDVELSNYFLEISKEFSGDGSIIVFPAGNLDDTQIISDEIFTSSKIQYLEGLARIDTSSQFSMNRKFSQLLADIQEEIDPSIILIDSRTGFNDVFGLTALNFADIVVGHFSNNAQSQPGLTYFIDRVLDSRKAIIAILVNSILARPGLFSKFQENVESYLQANSTNSEKSFFIKSFPISRYNLLETIGTKEEEKSEFIDLIRNKRFPDYNNLFEYINELTDDEILYDEIEGVITTITVDSKVYTDTKEDLTYTQENNYKAKELLEMELSQAYSEIQSLVEKGSGFGVQKILKQKVKVGLVSNWPKLYAEQTPDIKSDNIFYRRSMEDVFNGSKFIILGNKGTGKTFLYQALKIPEFVSKIRERAQKNGNYCFFHMIDISKSSNKFFDSNQFSSLDEKFYHRFWVVFIWNAIMLDSEEKLDYRSQLEVTPILNNTKTKLRFEKIINDDEIFVKIEDDLETLDNHLRVSKNHQKLVLIFDGLDRLVKPIDWSYKIIPLINYWRNHSFSSISAKLFIRSDLFEKLSNITNVKELKNQAISIEWTQEELFGYFFKLVLLHSKEEFLRYLCFTKNNSYELIRQIRQKAGKDNQLPLEKDILYPLVQSFFGKFASSDNSPMYGESYDWFYRNLKNANNTISLRPFIDLINNAFEYAESHDQSTYPILGASFYVHGEARKIALGNHFEDLAAEEGNKDLKIITNFIREKKSSQPVYLTMGKADFMKLLNEILKSSDLEHKTEDELLYLLKVNGVVSENFRSSGLSYSFALLYKYYLGLKTPPKRRLIN